MAARAGERAGDDGDRRSVRPCASVVTWRGMSRSQSIVKCGSTIFSDAGRLIQIWKSSVVFGPSLVEEREHLGVLDAASGRHPLHVTAPVARRRAERIGVVDEALPDERDGLEAAVRVDAGSPGTVLPWYIRQPSMPSKSLPIDRPSSGAVGPEIGVARRIPVEVVDAEEERIDRRPLESQRNGLEDGRSHGVSVSDHTCVRNEMPRARWRRGQLSVRR